MRSNGHGRSPRNEYDLLTDLMRERSAVLSLRVGRNAHGRAGLMNQSVDVSCEIDPEEDERGRRDRKQQESDRSDAPDDERGNRRAEDLAADERPNEQEAEHQERG